MALAPAAPHILYIAPFGMRHKTTVWARTLPLARNLVAQGMRCTILAPPWDSPEDGGLRQNVDGVEVVQVNVEGGLPAIVANLWREVKMRRPEIVHCVKPRAYAGILQWMLWQERARSDAGPRILLDLDDWEQAWQEVNHYAAPVARFLAWQEEWGIRHADGITVASHWLEARAEEYSPTTPLLYLPNGVEIPEAEVEHARSFRSGSPGNDAPESVLYFTRFVEITPEWFGAYVKLLVTMRPRIRLIVAGSPLLSGGDAPYRAAVAPEDRDKVVWLGYVPAQSLPGVYAASDIAIFPAAPTVLQQAKCSVRLATTLLHGVPVIASAVGEQAHYGDAGSALLLPSDATPETFARATTTFLEDRTSQTEIVTNARRHLTTHYRWSHLAASLKTFYESLLHSQI